MEQPDTLTEKVIKGVAGEYVGNYTGPDWSNGKNQSSVEWGDLPPQSQLDYLSRQHDSAYAKFPDRAHRDAADRIYNEQAKLLVGKFPQLAGKIVVYGNMAQQSFKRTASNFTNGLRFGGLAGALGGLIYTAGGNIIQANKMLDDSYLKREIAEVKKYYETDPLKDKFEHMAPKGKETQLRDGLSRMNKSPANPGPTVKDLRNEVLKASQIQRIENYNRLHKEALESTVKPKTIENEHVPYYRRPTLVRAKEKRKRKHKINKIYISTV